ncbi:MAG: rubredoxin [Candidatus Verstraetearchaeota archaeon]|jgi:rubredoxin|uniref:Rubredoxin n=1 Tax=Thermoproteota archaeon TaxID=2056631 RepID=A0A523BE75_9CREN|nr:rubredoxin [Candidatus Methanomethylicia archaeon]NHV60924.1 rubredoxin [Candidatus Verstraetearchaeota archaeon]TDA39184.1 MAG: rubredoxin [Candidatus Verstraetearchaeota archaeon]
MDKWACKVCGYIYDPEKGDEINNIPPGTPFEALPDTWVCPVCGAPKEMFEKIE